MISPKFVNIISRRSTINLFTYYTQLIVKDKQIYLVQSYLNALKIAYLHMFADDFLLLRGSPKKGGDVYLHYKVHTQYTFSTHSMNAE